MKRILKNIKEQISGSATILRTEIEHPGSSWRADLQPRLSSWTCQRAWLWFTESQRSHCGAIPVKLAGNPLSRRKSCSQGGVLGEVFCYKSVQRLPREVAVHVALQEPDTREVVYTAIEKCLGSHSQCRAWHWRSHCTAVTGTRETLGRAGANCLWSHRLHRSRVLERLPTSRSPPRLLIGIRKQISLPRNISPPQPTDTA